VASPHWSMKMKNRYIWELTKAQETRTGETGGVTVILKRGSKTMTMDVSKNHRHVTGILDLSDDGALSEEEVSERLVLIE